MAEFWQTLKVAPLVLGGLLYRTPLFLFRLISVIIYCALYSIYFLFACLPALVYTNLRHFYWISCFYAWAVKELFLLLQRASVIMWRASPSIYQPSPEEFVQDYQYELHGKTHTQKLKYKEPRYRVVRPSADKDVQREKICIKFYQSYDAFMSGQAEGISEQLHLRGNGMLRIAQVKQMWNLESFEVIDPARFTSFEATEISPLGLRVLMEHHNHVAVFEPTPSILTRIKRWLRRNVLFAREHPRHPLSVATFVLHDTLREVRYNARLWHADLRTLSRRYAYIAAYTACFIARLQDIFGRSWPAFSSPWSEEARKLSVLARMLMAVFACAFALYSMSDMGLGYWNTAKEMWPTDKLFVRLLLVQWLVQSWVFAYAATLVLPVGHAVIYTLYCASHDMIYDTNCTGILYEY